MKYAIDFKKIRKKRRKWIRRSKLNLDYKKRKFWKTKKKGKKKTIIVVEKNAKCPAAILLLLIHLEELLISSHCLINLYERNEIEFVSLTQQTKQ